MIKCLLASSVQTLTDFFVQNRTTDFFNAPTLFVQTEETNLSQTLKRNFAMRFIYKILFIFLQVSGQTRAFLSKDKGDSEKIKRK